MKYGIMIGLLCAAVLVAMFRKTVLVNLYLKLAIGRTTWFLCALAKKLTGRGKKNSVDVLDYKKRIWLHAQELKTVEIESWDGYTLTGHYLEHPEAERVILIFHGWRGAWDRDGDALAEGLYGKKCSILLVSQRAHEESEGQYIGFGVLERYDCMNWLQYLEKNVPNLPVYLAGVSMGASTVLMAAGLKLPERVKGVIADCGFTSPYDMVKIFAKNFMGMKELSMVDEVNRLCRRKAGYDLKEYSTLEAMKCCRIPVFFVHGTGDGFVPYEMTVKNYKACSSDKWLYTVEGAGHAKSYLTDPDKYIEELVVFFRWGMEEMLA